MFVWSAHSQFTVEVESACTKNCCLPPETSYETDSGFRNHVIFPGGMIHEPTGEVKNLLWLFGYISLSCAAHVNDLVQLCLKYILCFPFKIDNFFLDCMMGSHIREVMWEQKRCCISAMSSAVLNGKQDR
jgi:hypothetical protein